MDKKLVDMPLHKRVPINTLDGLHGMRESTLNHMTQWLQTAVQAEYPLCRGCGHAKINSAILQNIHDMSAMVHGTVKCEHTFCAKERQEMAITKMNDMWVRPWTTSTPGDMKADPGLAPLGSLKDAGKHAVRIDKHGRVAGITVDADKISAGTISADKLTWPTTQEDIRVSHETILREHFAGGKPRSDPDKPQTDVDAW
jgi:hypothetical protein